MSSHHLLAGVDIATISHPLGHASVQTANRYAVRLVWKPLPKPSSPSPKASNPAGAPGPLAGTVRVHSAQSNCDPLPAAVY